MQRYYLTRLLGIQGYRVASLAIEPGEERPTVVLELKRLRRSFECGKCHRKLKRAHSSWEVKLHHLSWWQYRTLLRVRHYRVNCPLCGLTLEPLPFAAEGPRVTRALASLVAELCKVMTVQAVAIFQGLHRGTVKALDKAALQKAQAQRSLEGIRVLGADEIAVGAGQTYWTLLHALEGPRGPECLFVAEGLREKDLKGFWKWFGRDRARQITHAVIDMWKPFKRSFVAHCPKVQLLYDKFHVIRHLLEALNHVRKAELHRAAKRFRGLLAGKKFILLSRKAHVRGRAREALHQLLGANRRLLKAHWLKESFNHLWSYRSKTWAKKFFQGWVAQLKWSRLKPYQRFARMVDDHLDGILAYCDKKISLGYVESANLKAHNAIRMAYGYRDKEYMKLKVIQACTPWMRAFRPWAFAHNNSS